MNMRHPIRLITLSVFVVAVCANAAMSHPMGNFSINRHATLSVGPSKVHLRYLVDMAEIPAFHEMPLLDTDGNKVVSEAERTAYLRLRSSSLIDGMRLSINGTAITAQPVASHVVVRTGAGGLATLFLTIETDYPLPSTSDTLRADFSDMNYGGRAGWRELIVTFDPAVSVESSTTPTTDQSKGLTDYPTDLLAAPPQLSRATFSFGLGSQEGRTAQGTPTSTSPTVGPVESPLSLRSDALTALVSGDAWSAKLMFVALGLAFVLGCGHALAPGHGKTVVAAYLIGSRATPMHACVLGLVVTGTHTTGVFALGLIVLFASEYVLPETIYPWLGFVSGMTIASIGGWQIVRRLAARYDPTASALGHVHGPGGHSHALPERITARSLIALGVSGGLIPCPSALVVLLGSIAAHRTLAGIGLVASFSLGLAAVLTAVGLLMLYARRSVDRFQFRSPIVRYMPVVSACAITVIGMGIAVQALLAGHLVG